MTKIRIIVLLSLLTLPIIFLSGVGAYYLWEAGWAFYAWWPMALCLGGAYFLAWRWQKQVRKLQQEAPVPLHWTERDQEAWKLVEGRVAVADKVPEEQFAMARFYFDVGQEMAQELAKLYRPNATDPIGLVTVPEILSVIELATHDLNELTQKYVPGSHLLTIDNVRSARTALKWYRMGTNVYWAASAVFDPVRTATRFVAARYGVGKPLEMFQQNVILWFHAAYVRKVGEYLIELYSGRLKVGAARYRELKGVYTAENQAVVPEPTMEVPPPPGVSVAIIGQVKAGKSSLINALLGAQKAATDVVPLTTGVTRYELHAPELRAQLGLLDTAGYAHAGPSADDVQHTAEAVQNCDLLILVLHARNSGRKADVDFLAQLHEWFRARPQLKMPPVLVVLTHVDLLTPAMEWSPPYDRFHGTRLKEKSMAEAIAAVREVFPEAKAIVVCRAEEGKLWGIDEEVFPAIVALLGEAKAVAFLRCVHAEADEGNVKRIFQQLWATGKKAYELARGTSAKL